MILSFQHVPHIPLTIPHTPFIFPTHIRPLPWMYGDVQRCACAKPSSRARPTRRCRTPGPLCTSPQKTSSARSSPRGTSSPSARPSRASHTCSPRALRSAGCSSARVRPHLIVATLRSFTCGFAHRAGLIYHPHFRPLTSPVAALLDLSASLHAAVPPGLPTPSRLLRAAAAGLSPRRSSALVAPSPLDAVANALTIPPIHVDHVGEAICIAADSARTDVEGVVDVQEMRRLIGWTQKGQPLAEPPVRDPAEPSRHV